jgi:hypothetical protein
MQTKGPWRGCLGLMFPLLCLFWFLETIARMVWCKLDDSMLGNQDTTVADRIDGTARPLDCDMLSCEYRTSMTSATNTPNITKLLAV